MNKKLKYAFITGAVIGVAAAFFLFTGNDASGSARSNTPEAALQEFYSSLTSGDFGKAADLCDQAAMESYLSSYKAEWEELKQADSTAHAEVMEMMKNTEIIVSEITEEEGRCQVTYRIEALGSTKIRTAELRKEEGEWLVEKITDAN